MALSFNSPTPRCLRRPDHPNLFLLGFSTKTHSKLLFISSTVLMQQAGQGVGQGGQGRAGQGRAGGRGRCRGRGRGRAGFRVITLGPVLVPRTTCSGTGLPPPWLWRGGQVYGVALRHRGQGA